MRIAIYGGTFNPIHKGHTSLSQALIEQQIVDEVWLIVSPQNPHKEADAAPYEDRLAMAQLATQGMEGIRVSDFERNLPIPSYTYTTLTLLSEQYPQHQFYLVIGADNWTNFPRWYHATDILCTYPILIYPRPNYPVDLTTAPKGSSVTIIEAPLYDISSTDIRQHKKIRMIHPDVRKYIRAHHLYNY